MESELSALTIIFTEFYYWVTVVIMFLIHVGFCLYEVGVAREKNKLNTLMKNAMLIPTITVAFFFVGWWINYRSDRTLIRLRSSTSTGYSIPHGGLYRWISNPNYLGEIIEWSGWAVASWSLGGLAFATYTVANLAPRALATHRWYRDQFPDYPSTRKALLPFVL